MQKARVWKVLLLSVVTLGFYWFYWIVTRRDQMVKEYKQVIPRWLWMVVPSLLVLVFLIPLVFIGVASATSTYDMTLWMMAYMVLGLTVAYIISIWWMWKFSQAAERVTNGRITAGWTIALYIFIGLFVIPFLQYYFNRSPSAKALKAKTALEPTTKFKLTAMAAIVLMTLALAPIGLLDWNSMQPDRADSKTQDLFTRSEKLYADYQTCINRLNTDFPEITAENETAYNAAQAHCEDIRIEQNKTVDEYDKMTGR